jgi:YaiO family outer membrane protein
MMTYSLHLCFAGLLLISTLAISPARAQNTSVIAEAEPAPMQQAVSATPPSLSPKLLTNYLESGGSYLALTEGYGYWASGYSRIVYQHGGDVWAAEMNAQREFGDAGVYFAAGDTHTFSPQWYGSLNLGSSAGGFFWPRFRGDAFLNKKWLVRKQWITTLGYTYFEAKDVHRNHGLFAGSTYYFEKPWILEEGVYLNINNPGKVFAPSGFVAVTTGNNKKQYLTLRVGLGEEGYQLVGPVTTLAQFKSQSLTITWRKWLGASWGVNTIGDAYSNPYYKRGGSSVGLFKEF